MKIKLFYATAIALSLFSAGKVNSQNIWIQKANYGPGNIGECAGFSTATQGFIVMGYNGTYQIGVWSWNPGNNTWTQKTNFPGTGKRAASGAEDGGHGFVIAGRKSTGFTAEVWEYFPGTDSWSQKANFPGLARYRGFAVADTVNHKIYYGGGDNGGSNYLSDFWVYDISSDTWTQKANFPGGQRAGSCGFFLNGYIYWGTGNNNDHVYDASNDWWQYNPANNTWTQMTSLPRNAQRRHATTFTIGGKGFVMLGDSTSASAVTGFLTDLWMYDPMANTWTQKANYPGIGVALPVGFSIGRNGYAGTGSTSSSYSNEYYEYTDSTIGEGVNEIASNAAFSVYPNPASSSITLLFKDAPAHGTYFSIYNNLGQEIIANSEVKNEKVTISLNGITPGLYIVKVTNGAKQTINKFIVN